MLDRCDLALALIAVLAAVVSLLAFATIANAGPVERMSMQPTLRQALHQVWEDADRAYGARANSDPMPRFKTHLRPCREDAAACVADDGNGYRAVYMGRQMRRGIKAGERIWQSVLLHEWAHIYQTARIVRECLRGREGGADLHAEHWARELWAYPFNGAYGSRAKRAFRRCVGPDRRDYLRRQFGRNWGDNPRFIRWPGATASASPQPRDFAYGMVLAKGGGWRGPTYADGRPNYRIIDAIRQARPNYVRVGPAPYQTNAVMAPRGETEQQLRSLKASGIQLGVGVNSGRPMKGSNLAQQGYGLRPAEDVIEHARRIKNASPGLYDFMLLDFAVLHDERRMQRIVAGVRALGFRTIVNAGGVGRNNAELPLPKGAWAFQRATTSLGGPDWRRTARRIANFKQPVLGEPERAFIRDQRKRRPNAHPMLRFTVPEQVVFRFAKLSRSTQRGLLTRLARAQSRWHYSMTYPLWLPGMAESYRGGARAYDARGEGTYWHQVKLMERY